MKKISSKYYSNGQTNDAVAMYASLPAFIYLNYTWMGYLLDASLDYENSLPPRDNFAALPDMGAYPQATEANPGPGSVEGMIHLYQLLC